MKFVGPPKVGNAVADLSQHSQHTRVARDRELEIVDVAVPKCSLNRIADVIEHRIIDAAAARLVQLEGLIQQELVRQLLACQTPMKRPAESRSSVVLVKGLERISPGNLPKLDVEILDLSSELDPEL